MRHAVLALALLFAASSCSPPEAASAPTPEAASPQAQTPAAEVERDALTIPEPPTRPAAEREESGGYQYVDETGHLRVAARLEDVPERQRSTATPLSPPKSRPSPAAGSDSGEPDAFARAADVTIYSTPGCGWCRRAIAYFDEKGVDYTNRDISSDAEAYAEYDEITRGRPGVPVIVVGNDWMQGWNPARFDELLASER